MTREIFGTHVPEGQKLWFWLAGGETGHLLFAKDYDEAYRKVMAARLEGYDPTPETVANEQRWFSKNDSLEEVVAELVIAPFAGELPDIDD